VRTSAKTLSNIYGCYEALTAGYLGNESAALDGTTVIFFRNVDLSLLQAENAHLDVQLEDWLDSSDLQPSPT
jgi:hypothetical protein